MAREIRGKLPAELEKAFEEGRGAIVDGRFCATREEVPAKWFREDDPERSADRERMEAHLAARETLAGGNPAASGRASEKTASNEVTNG